MSTPWSHERLQEKINAEIAAVAYSETHRGAWHARPVGIPEEAWKADHRSVFTVVVGVDRSEASDHALAWAAVEAAGRGARLVLVRVEEPRGDLPPSASACAAAENALGELAAAVRGSDPRLHDVATEVVAGAAGPELVRRAQDADLLVVGSHARGPVSRALLGSVSAYCATHADRPTVVVPQGWSGRRVTDART